MPSITERDISDNAIMAVICRSIFAARECIMTINITDIKKSVPKFKRMNPYDECNRSIFSNVSIFEIYP